MSPGRDPRQRLLDLAGEYRHLRAEHGRASPEGSTRRRLDQGMRDAAERVERLLAELDLTDDERRAWHDHMHHGAPAPDRPEPAPPDEAPPPPPDRPSGQRPWPR